MVNKEEIYNAHLRVEQYKIFFCITERDNESTSATFDSETVFWTDTWPRHLDYSQFNFPYQLPDVPQPTKITVDTGKEIPVDGIWEPEWIDPAVKKNKVVTLRSLFTSVEPDNLQKGCMNYLVAGTIAPPYQDGMQKPVMPVRWRLIWQDTRYTDGTIPDEEKEYLAPAPERRPNEMDSGVLRATAGEECPRAGYWQSQDGKTETRFYMERESFADLGSGYGLTIWQYVGKSRRIE
ncbi:Imm72 family immunity protein [Noviherbaspirillum sp.]|jgi:hypothetical protein|uniref:Imm72 family immunity protein n=1 Tax=Noviherbaspirillum sp. TaxID=1926288 RepID=UPI0025D8A6EA|nr:Imm72 family immunity protein [Noviherbaspirillum sp.]